jgi:hypothetical protein
MKPRASPIPSASSERLERMRAIYRIPHDPKIKGAT